MNKIIYSNFFIFITICLSLLGCSKEQDKLKLCAPTVKIVEKVVVAKCEIPPIHCEFKGDGYTPTKKLLECVKLQKEALKICTE